MLEVLPIDTVTFWTRSEETARAFQAAVEHHGLLVKPLDSPRAVVESADVVCTLTPSVTPIVSGHGSGPGSTSTPSVPGPGPTTVRSTPPR